MKTKKHVAYPGSVRDELDQYTTNLNNLQGKLAAHQKNGGAVSNDLMAEVTSLLTQMAIPNVDQSLTSKELCTLSDRCQAALDRGTMELTPPILS